MAESGKMNSQCSNVGWISRFSSLVVSVIFVSAAAVPGREADYSDPVPLTDDGGVAHLAMCVDRTNTVYALSISDSQLTVDVVGSNVRKTFDLPGGGRRDGDIVNRVPGGAFLCFSRQRNGGDGGHDVFFTRLVGGSLTSPERVSSGEGDNLEAKLCVDRQGESHVVWARSSKTQPTYVVYQKRSTGQTLDLHEGSSPSVAFDSDNIAHVVYTRGNRIFSQNYVPENQSFTPATVVATAASDEGVAVDFVADGDGNLYALYTIDDALYVQVKPARSSQFDHPQWLDSEGVADPAIHVHNGVVAMVYTKGGDLYTIVGTDGVSTPVALGGLAVSESTFVVDSCGIGHLSFESGGDAFYINDAEVPEVDFTADVRRGDADLTVAFQSSTEGKVQAYDWDFGDGRGSGHENPKHDYRTPGVYTVTLTVYNADKQASSTREDLVEVLVPSNRLEMPDREVLPGERNVQLPIFGTNDDRIQGFQLHGVFDHDVLSLRRCTQELTVIEALEPEVWECNITENRFEIGVVFETEKPFDNLFLEPGEGQVLVNLFFHVSNVSPQGVTTEIRLLNDVDTSPVFNIFIVDGLTLTPHLGSAFIHVLEHELREFTRGDADASNEVNITDAIFTLNYLFLGGERPVCLDAGDFNDVGSVDISSAIGLLQFLFQGGASPGPPFPENGLDPTDEDDLEPCYES